MYHIALGSFVDYACHHTNQKEAKPEVSTQSLFINKMRAQAKVCIFVTLICFDFPKILLLGYFWRTTIDKMGDKICANMNRHVTIHI